MGSKKDKKDKKHKSEKKSKKDSKSSKKKSSKDKKHKSSRDDVAESELATILNTAVFTNPKLMGELPLIMKSLDDGEYVDVYSITKKFTREIVAQLMKHLPVLYDPAQGFYKDSINTNVSEYVVRELTKQQIVKAPNELSMSEALASKNVVHKLMELLSNFPDLKGELGGLFGTIIDGHSVQLDSLDNEDIRDGLEDLFRAIGMENSADGFTLPEGRRSNLVREALEHLNNAFSMFTTAEEKRLQAEERAERDESPHTRREQEGDRSGSSSSSDSGSEDSQHSDDEKDDQVDSFYPSDRPSGAVEAEIIGPAGPPEAPSQAGPVKGPSMPTLSDLHSARALIEQQRRAGVHHPSTHADESSSDDDGFGPQLCDTQTARVLQAQMSAVPLGFTGAEVDPAFERAFEAENAGVNSRLRGEIYTGEAHKVEDETKREEWILNPGDSKLAASLSGAGLTNRKFQAGKGAKKAAEQMSIQREFQRQQQALQAAQSQAQHGGKEGFISTDAVMQDYREKRGESLMEAHLAKKARTTSSEVTTGVGSGKQQRRAFDREIDMASHSKMNEDKVSKLVQNAKELDDRFDKGSVQKSFL